MWAVRCPEGDHPRRGEGDRAATGRATFRENTAALGAVGQTVTATAARGRPAACCRAADAAYLTRCAQVTGTCPPATMYQL
ncbi:hypothetical protein GCM10010307_72330 [Streptomyces vastus]|uniref:Uncharacterized protein n=1 Tax=Streptomyces vastus TaxID=285451 RepID=A0ABN3RSI1_9ACTN